MCSSELRLVEQRYPAVREVLNDGASVTDVARRNDVSRQTVHEWLVKYANRTFRDRWTVLVPKTRISL